MTFQSCDCGITQKTNDNPLGLCRACRVHFLQEASGTAAPSGLDVQWDRFVRKVMPWLLSAITIWMNWLAGSLDPRAWAVGLCAQVLWLLWIVHTRTWGLLPMNLALWAVYARNHFAWAMS